MCFGSGDWTTSLQDLRQSRRFSTYKTTGHDNMHARVYVLKYTHVCLHTHMGTHAHPSIHQEPVWAVTETNSGGLSGNEG